MSFFFVFFFISGFCSILYELVWLRLAMARFGVTSAMVSIVLSMFMAGLGLGSWGSGRLIRRYGSRWRFPALQLYALVELLIGISAILVPHEMNWGRSLLANLPLSSSWSYYAASGSWVALTLIPWCACMGATIPIAMQAIRKSFEEEAERSFSYLYLANVLGAVAGATVPLLLIEAYGFRGTLRVGVCLNALLAASAMALTLGSAPLGHAASAGPPLAAEETKRSAGRKSLLILLFLTGFTSMGIEVVWIRQFTPYLGTVVYAFAAILAVYLAFTFIGSRIYRRWGRESESRGPWLWALVGFFALLSAVTANPELYQLSALARLILGIAPFSGLLGFVTPMLVDIRSAGDPNRAGSAYAINVVGCILGPLVSGFILLPLISERWALLVFAAPWLLIGAAAPAWTGAGSGDEARRRGPWQRGISYAFIAVALAMMLVSKDYEDQFEHRAVLRDNTATVVATGEGMKKRLLINGVGVTYLTPVTKVMAHLPLAFLDHRPQNALVICFGMGTTFRSLLSWNIPTTAVELVPSVPKVFWYFHPDGEELVHSPLAHVVIDDGRRYLERTSEQYDVITLDPPPPVEAAASSLLYSKEFYTAVKQHLRPGGVLQQWLPYADPVTLSSFARALKESFPYVRAFRALTGGERVHFLASNSPLPNWTASDLVSHMPDTAVKDLMEWGPQPTPERQFAVVLDRELSLDDMIAGAPDAPTLQDDRPMNEYYALRRHVEPALRRYMAFLDLGRKPTAVLQP